MGEEAHPPLLSRPAPVNNASQNNRLRRLNCPQYNFLIPATLIINSVVLVCTGDGGFGHLLARRCFFTVIYSKKKYDLFDRHVRSLFCWHSSIHLPVGIYPVNK